MSTSERRTARLLSTVLALLAPLALTSLSLQLVAGPDADGTATALAVAIAAIVGAYALSRTRFFRLAGAITTLIPTVAGLAVLAAAADDPGWFAFMGLNPALGALFLAIRWATLLAAVNLVAVVVGVVVTSSLDADTAIVAVMFNAIIAIVLLTAAGFRNTLERDRRADLVARQRLQQTILDGTFGGIAVVRDGVITDANRVFAELVDRAPDELVGTRLADVGELAVTGSLDRRGGDPLEVAVTRPDGTEVDIEVVARPIDDERTAVVVALRDITERKEAERALLRAQRMESAGRLAAGLAHDTGNELLVISALTEQLRIESRRRGADTDTVDRIDGAAKRVAGMIRRVLVVGRDERPEADVVDVGVFLTESSPMWRQVLGDGIALELEISDVGDVHLPRADLDQLLLNLVLNARDAMPSGGSLRIEASIHHVRATGSPADGPAPGRYQQLTVADDGDGIDDADLERIFDPFFTTKAHGLGTGLGLFNSRSVVRQARGEMTAHSDGDGSVFTVLLPLHEPPHDV